MKTVCIVCRNELTNLDEYQPIGGTHFYTYGHYGSTITDCMNGSSHNICVCDECLQKALDDNIAFKHMV